ncbi:MAG: hypothetical protein KatS3mg110_0226 [Pirellulaceae bacterium]|nr:MAG: hypothetical protein KatS3mg110_0226 [Pirellulaceae bacterium]
MIADCHGETMATSSSTFQSSTLPGYPQLGVLLCDETGSILAANDWLVRWTGQDRKALIGRSVDEVLTVRCTTWLVVGEKNDGQCQLPLKQLDGHLHCRGSRQPVAGVMALVVRAERPVWATLLWPSEPGDVTQSNPQSAAHFSDGPRIGLAEYRKLQHCCMAAKQQLTRVRAKLKQALRTKQQFLSLVSHELRTPIHGTLGMLDLLAATPLSVKQRHYVHVAQRTSRSLLTMVNDLIALTDLQTGAERPVCDRCDLPALMQQASQWMEKTSQEEGLTFYGLLDPSACVAAICDQTSIARLLKILLDSAARSLTGGTVTLRMRLVTRGSGRGRLYFTVSDAGPGLTAGRWETSAGGPCGTDLSAGRPLGGIGLELSLCTELIKKLNGRLRIRTVQRSGSVFQVVLPVAIAEVYSPAHKSHLPFKGLCVWDGRSDTVAQRHLRRCLRYWGAQWRRCATCEDGVAAVRNARQQGLPAVLVVDHSQQHSVGKSEASCGPADLPILVTSSQPEGTRTTCGAFDTQQLYDQLRKLVKRMKSGAVAGSGPIPSSPAKADTDRPDTASENVMCVNTAGMIPRLRGNVLVVEDNPVNQLYLSELLKLMGCTCYVAGDGKAAIQAADNIPFDLVLLDCQIPEMDGFSVTRHIRHRHPSNGTAASVPIVGVTATCDDSSRREAMLSGMTEIVAKPIEGDDLRALLVKYLPLAS